MPLYIAKSGDLDRCYRCLTDSLTHSQMKDRATQLLIKYKSGALVTQQESSNGSRPWISSGMISDPREMEYQLPWNWN